MPYMFFTPRYKQGTMIARFALRVESGTAMRHEWRFSNSALISGPSFSIVPSDAPEKAILRSADQMLMEIPTGQWVQYEIRCKLGTKADGLWQFRVQLPNERSWRVFKNLKCDPLFRECQWVGFISNGNFPGSYYLDDVSLGIRQPFK